MITVIEQNANIVVLEGTVEGHPELTERHTVFVSGIAADPTLLARKRDQIAANLATKLANWQAAKAAIAAL